MIEISGTKVYLDFMLLGGAGRIAVMSYYDRSLTAVKAIGGSLNFSSDLVRVLSEKGTTINRVGLSKSQFNTYIQPIVVGKEKFYHAIAINSEINKSMILLYKQNEAEGYYNYLMQEFNLPLLKEWGDALFHAGLVKNCIHKERIHPLIKGRNSITATIPMGNKKIPLEEITAYTVNLGERELESQVQRLFAERKISISDKPQKKLEFTDMDTYFQMYGSTLVANLEKTIDPLTELSGDVSDFTLNTMRLYPQQIAQINGILELLDHSNYSILNMGMGTGKTVIGASVCEAYHVRKWLRAHPGKTLKDAYTQDNAIKYRNIIVCPGHLVSKWKSEIQREVPGAKVEIINEFRQLVEIRERGKERTGREFYVMSKDFGKLSYQSRPCVKKRSSGFIMQKQCNSCDTVFRKAGKRCPQCGGKEYTLLKTSYKSEGMKCPHCNQLLLPYKTAKLEEGTEPEDLTRPLDYYDFATQNDANSKCYYCDAELWEPHVSNLGESKNKQAVWSRATHYSNKAHKGTKTVWVHRHYTDAYFERIGEKPLNYMDGDERKGSRKYAPSRFIQKYMNGYWDFAVFDEMQAYKGGTTGQGISMGALVAASKKQLGLTGTIAGGKADDLYYLLYRFDSRRMQQRGYKYSDVMKFSEKYGRVEKVFEYNESATGNYNVCCRGKQKGSPRVKAGISPLIFMDFLLDKCCFLDISDMSKHLPQLKEKVELIEIEEKEEQSFVEVQMLQHYKSVVDNLTRYSKENDVGFSILSTMLQFSLSYLDKPYGVGPIRSPKTGSTLIIPKSFDTFMDYTQYDNLLSKEKRLVEIVSQEISEGRNCFVYAEFTASPETCITGRLQAILEHYIPELKGKVTVLESTSPVASKREEWIHKKAKAGTRVFITNPKCVETGLDFRFRVDGVVYNYQTIIFYQLGYSMFTVAQAARRHYRLNQREECRTYYFGVRGTIQEAVIQIIAEKTSATAAISGHFSTEGLAAMANGVDVKVKLAQAMANMDTTSGNKLQEMFDVNRCTKAEDTALDEYKPMLLYSELMADTLEAFETAINEMDKDEFDCMFNFFDYMDELSKKDVADTSCMKADMIDLKNNDLFEGTVFFSSLDEDINLSLSPIEIKKKKKKVSAGQLDIFSLLEQN